MNMKEMTLQALQEFSAVERVYLCLQKPNETPGEFPHHAFLLLDTGINTLYIGNFFAFIDGTETPELKQYSSIEEIIDDGWLVD